MMEGKHKHLGIRTGYSQSHSQSDLGHCQPDYVTPRLITLKTFPNSLRVKAEVTTSYNTYSLSTTPVSVLPDGTSQAVPLALRSLPFCPVCSPMPPPGLCMASIFTFGQVSGPRDLLGEAFLVIFHKIEKNVTSILTLALLSTAQRCFFFSSKTSIFNQEAHEASVLNHQCIWSWTTNLQYRLKCWHTFNTESH